MTILVFLMLLAWGQDGPAMEMDTFVAVIQDKDGYVNVRDEPDKGGRAVDKLYTGERFYVRGFEDWEWFEVCTPRGTWGYAHRSRLKKVQRNAYYPAQVVARAELLSAPGKGAVITLPRGQLVITLGDLADDVTAVFKEDRWFQVMTTKGQLGYVHSSRLKPFLQP